MSLVTEKAILPLLPDFELNMADIRDFVQFGKNPNWIVGFRHVPGRGLVELAYRWKHGELPLVAYDWSKMPHLVTLNQQRVPTPLARTYYVYWQLCHGTRDEQPFVTAGEWKEHYQMFMKLHHTNIERYFPK